MQAAKRELQEETGICADIDSELWNLTVEFNVGETVIAQAEKYFLVALKEVPPNLRNTTPEAIAEHRWWSIGELSATSQTIYPEGLVDLLRKSGVPFV